jgi:hypothetical protein
MAVQELIQYVQEKTNQGYDPASIRSFLIGQGYPPSDVDKAFNYFQPKKRQFSATSFMGMALFVLGVALIMLASINMVGKKVGTEVTIQTSLLSKSFKPGSPLNLQVDISGEGKLPATSTLRYRISDRDGKTVFYKGETIAVTESRSLKRSILLPDSVDLPGDYVLDTEATIGEKAFVSSFQFNIQRIEGEKEISFKVTDEPEKTFVRQKDPSLPDSISDVSSSDVVRMEGA